MARPPWKPPDVIALILAMTLFLTVLAPAIRGIIHGIELKPPNLDILSDIVIAIIALIAGYLAKFVGRGKGDDD